MKTMEWSMKRAKEKSRTKVRNKKILNDLGF
jgi:hypothetical protein